MLKYCLSPLPGRAARREPASPIPVPDGLDLTKALVLRHWYTDDNQTSMIAITSKEGGNGRVFMSPEGILLVEPATNEQDAKRPLYIRGTSPGEKYRRLKDVHVLHLGDRLALPLKECVDGEWRHGNSKAGGFEFEVVALHEEASPKRQRVTPPAVPAPPPLTTAPTPQPFLPILNQAPALAPAKQQPSPAEQAKQQPTPGEQAKQQPAPAEQQQLAPIEHQQLVEHAMPPPPTGELTSTAVALFHPPDELREETVHALSLVEQHAYRHFDGRCVLLNRLILKDVGECAPGSSSHVEAAPPAMAEASRAELIWRHRHLQTALFTSYGTDYHFLSELVRDPATLELAPAAARPRGVVVVDNYDHHRTPAGLDEETYTLNNPSVRAHFSVVLPPFFAADAAAADRTRVHHGTMHPKMWLLEFDAGGVVGSGFLRMVISSANLGRYDAKINNQLWACDFVRTRDAMATVGKLSVRELKRELTDEWRVDISGLCEMSELHQALLDARREGSYEFRSDLSRFVRRLLHPTAPQLYEQWQELLDQYELTPPAGTHLIISAPGRYPMRCGTAPLADRWTGAPTSLSAADQFGLRALKRHLKAALTNRPKHEAPSRVEYGCSSLGQLEDIMCSLLGRLPPNYTKDAVEPAGLDNCGALITGCVNAPGQRKEAFLLWPTLTTSLPAFRTGKGMLTIGGGKNTMTGPSDFKCKSLENCMANNVSASAARMNTLHHIKVAAAVVHEAGRTADSPDAPLVAWLYAGSHNLSAAAWGKVEVLHERPKSATSIEQPSAYAPAMRSIPLVERTEEGVPMEVEEAPLVPRDAAVLASQSRVPEEEDDLDDDDECSGYELVCMSYEIGVLRVPPKPMRHALPWRSPAEVYDPTKKKPFSTSRYLALLRGSESRAWTDVDGSRESIRDLAARVEHEWRRLQYARRELHGACLPPILKIPMANVRKLVEVEVKVAETVIDYAGLPKPASATRRRSRHLRSGGTTDELPQRGQQRTLPVGERRRAVRVDDFSYGEGDVMGATDPILTVYEAVHEGPSAKYFDDFDRTAVDVPLEGSRRTRSVEVVNRDGPKGVLLAFLAEDGSDAGNEPLLLALSAAATEVKEACWGVMLLEPSELAGRAGPDTYGREPPPTPSHADLLAFEFGIDPAAELPALILLTRDMQTRMFECKGAAALSGLAASSAAGLKRDLHALASQEVIDTKPTTSWWRRMAERRTTRAAEAAAWIRSRGVKLLLIEPEGILKKQTNISIVPSASIALSKRRASLWGALRYDAFLVACVPFLRQLLLQLPHDGDAYDADSQYGNGPPIGCLRADAPSIALVTNFGHVSSRARPGEAEESKVPEEKVRSVMAALMARLASELGLTDAQLSTKVSLRISFRAPGTTSRVPTSAPAPEEPKVLTGGATMVAAAAGGVVLAIEGEEWSEAWAKPQPGMLFDALEQHGVGASAALMVGYDFVDQEAASRAGVMYVNQQHLLGVENFDTGFDEKNMNKESERIIEPGAAAKVRAPGSFAAEKRSKEGQMPRSPSKAAGAGE